MGKLAERLADAKRPGVYRIEVAHALEEAVTLNNFSPAGFEGLIRNAGEGVLDHPLLSRLGAAAARRRAAALRFFAVFLDPAAMLTLAPLYG